MGGKYSDYYYYRYILYLRKANDRETKRNLTEYLASYTFLPSHSIVERRREFGRALLATFRELCTRRIFCRKVRSVLELDEEEEEEQKRLPEFPSEWHS